MARRNPTRVSAIATAVSLATAAVGTLGCSDERATTTEPPPTMVAPVPPAKPAVAARAARASWPVPTALPGSEPFPIEVRAALGQALALRAPEYEPRTHHLRADGSPRFTNRLILESSPYLRQHAHNPVDWRPWGEEAFAEARRLGRPVFLSIGYSTCHWCHVMERESFEDEEIAALLNSKFIPIKVDREERPDIDAVYMEAVRLLSGGGGWPMTVVLTPEREPFFGGTYFPARAGDRGNRSGLREILGELSALYAEDPERATSHAARITERLRVATRPRPPGDVPGATAILRTQAALAQSYDSRWGGFGSAPKFPRPVTIELLLRHARRTGDPTSRAQALGTLDRMAEGGLRDHVGGGFHRYATDREWKVPHFEKMLYDNAQLALVYLDAYQITGEGRHARVAREILSYLRREMTSPEGAFYSATDADSRTPGGHDEEGWFFTWTPDEIDEVLDAPRAALITKRYGVSAEGNFEGRNILHDAQPLEDVAREAGLSKQKAHTELLLARRALYLARAKRPAPLRDEKILAAWNGLAISAFARGARVLGEPDLAAAGEAAARVLLERMTVDGRLARSYVDGRAAHDAILDDYAFVIAGLLDLYEASFDPQWLRAALALQNTVDADFWDRENGGYYLTARAGEELLVRRKDVYDGARPAGNSVAASNLLRLHAFTNDDAYRERAERLFAAFAEDLRSRPSASPRLLSALDFHLDTPKEILLIQPRDDDPGLAPFLDVLAGQYLPNAVIAAVTEGPAADALAELVPLVAGKRARDEKVTAYVCENRVCALPTTDPAEFARQIRKVRPYDD